MKKTILILLILMCAIGSQAQTTAQRLTALEKSDILLNKKIDTLNWTVSKLLALSQRQDTKIAYQDSVMKAFQNGIVRSNTMVYKRPLIGEKDSVLLNTFNISIDTLYLKR